jgi:hypothetical protein
MYTAKNVKNIATFQGGASISEAVEKTQLIEPATAILAKYIFATTRIFLVSISNYKYKYRKS